MSSSAKPAPSQTLWERLPAPLRPLERERTGSGRRRRVEAVVLLLVAAVIAASVIYDVTRQVGINYRLTADIETWRELTGHHFKNISIERDTRHYTDTDVACANTGSAFVKPGHKTQICFVLVGPILHLRIDGRVQERRATYGGFFVPPFTSTGYKVNRYSCFGRAVAERRCKRATPPGEPHIPPPGFVDRDKSLGG